MCELLRSLPGDSSPTGELMLELRLMFWNLGVILWGWGLVKSCLGVWPNSRICVSMAILWSVSSMLPRQMGGGTMVSDDPAELSRITNNVGRIFLDTCHSRSHLHRSTGEKLKKKKNKDKAKINIIFSAQFGFKVRVKRVTLLPLWASTASLPLCLKPNTRSIHSWRCSETYWLSRAILCFLRKSLASGKKTKWHRIT